MNAHESGTIAVLAEKPSVARDIARVLGADKRGTGYLHGNGYVVTWAIGHLVSLAQPHEIHPQWKLWRREPSLCCRKNGRWWSTKTAKTNSKWCGRFSSLARVARMVCATDAGREGELIFRYIYEAAKRKALQQAVDLLANAGCHPQRIRQPQAGRDYERLADAACGRSRADWLVGMNLVARLFADL